MAVIDLCRRSRGGRPSGAKSDVRVYAAKEKGSKKRFSIGVRLSDTVMRRLRWIVGDLVRASFDDTSMTWTLRRVADKTGNRLSGQGRKDGAGTVRFCVDASQLSALGLDGDEGYDCTLVNADGDSASFRKD